MKPNSPVFRLDRRGMTLVELLTVVGIVGVLSAILIPVIGGVRESARISTSLGNLRQLGIAVQLFSAENRGQLPIYYLNNPTYPAYGWTPALWKLLYSSQAMPLVTPVPDTGAQFRKIWAGTVFLTPLLEDGNSVRSYGYNMYLCRYTGATPYSANLAPLTMQQIANPARTVLLGDSQLSWQLRIDTNPVGRSDGRVLCVFADGHTDRLLPPVQGDENPSSAERRMPYNTDSTFWRGVARDPAGNTLVVW